MTVPWRPDNPSAKCERRLKSKRSRQEDRRYCGGVESDDGLGDFREAQSCLSRFDNGWHQDVDPSYPN